MSRNRRSWQGCRGFRGSPVSSRRIIDYALKSLMNDLLSHLKQDLPQGLWFLEQMVSMESPSFDKPLVDKFVSFLGRQFNDIGGAVEFIPSEKFGNHLLVRFQGNARGRILLLGHTDTVWPTGEIEKRPFKIAGGRALGPGVFDMKDRKSTRLNSSHVAISYA